MADIVDISGVELDQLIFRINEARDNHLSLSPEDTELLLTALETLSHMQERLSERDITLHKLRKLLGIEKASEKLRDVVPAETTDESADKKKTPSARRSSPSKRPKKKTPPSESTAKPKVIYHGLDNVKKGDACPECPAGILYKTEPASFLRIVGHSPFSAEQHLAERLRCGACGVYFTAEYPESVNADGGHQKYGFSARSVMAIQRYFAGAPFYRQESLQTLLGLSITASTIYDQCEYLANDFQGIFNTLLILSGNAPLLYLDDTPNRILNQVPVMRKKRNSDKEHLRKGIYTSGLIATTEDDHLIAVFKTNIGHAGEWIDEILSHRVDGLSLPTLMCDALSGNQPTVLTPQLSLCNAHGRRQFVDVIEHFRPDVEWVLEQYQGIWVNDTACGEAGLDPIARLAYHQEHSLPIMARLREWGEQKLSSDDVEENSGLGKAIRYFIHHYEGLTGFCRYVGAPLDNNTMERTLKLIIRGRKNSLFYKTLAGAAVADVLCSIIATAASADINVFDYFNAVQRHSIEANRNPEAWLPWNYQEQLAA